MQLTLLKLYSWSLLVKKYIKSKKCISFSTLNNYFLKHTSYKTNGVILKNYKLSNKI